MADNRDPSLQDRLIKTSEVILGAGVVAAAAYSFGGKRLLSTQLNRAGTIARAIAPDIASKSLKDFDAKTLLTLTNEHFLKDDSVFKNVMKTEQNSVKLGFNKTNNSVGFLKKVLEFSNNKNKFLSKVYDDEKIVNPLKETFKTNYKNNDDTFYSKLIKNVLNNRDQFILYKKDGAIKLDQEIVDKAFKGTDFSKKDQEDMIANILERMERKKQEFETFSEQRQELIDNITNEMQDFDNLSKRFGSSEDMKTSDKFFDELLGDTNLTLKQLVDKHQNGEINIANKDIKLSQPGTQEYIDLDFLDHINQLIQQDERIGSVYVGGVRVDDTGVYDFGEMNALGNKMFDGFANTLPGKLVKTRDIYYAKNSPSMHYFDIGKSDPILSSFEKNINSTINNNYLRILDKTYKINGNDLEHINELDDYYLTSGRHGAIPRIVKALAGDEERKVAKNKVFDMLDLGTSTAPSQITEFMSFFKKFRNEKWAPNVTKSLKEHGSSGIPLNEDYIKEYKEQMDILNNFFHNSAVLPSKKGIKGLIDNSTGRAKQLFETLNLADDDFIEAMYDDSFGYDSMTNKDLVASLKRLKSDSEDFLNSKSIVSDKMSFLPETRAKSPIEMMKIEIFKEGMVASKKSNKGYNNAYHLIESSVKGQDKREAMHLLNWMVLQDTSKFSRAKSTVVNIDNIIESMQNSTRLFTAADNSPNYDSDTAYIKKFQDSMAQNLKDKAHVLQKGFEREEVGFEEIVDGSNYGKWMLMRKSQGFVDTLKNLNDETKVKAFGKQFIAGRKNMEDVTTATMFPYFMVSRLFDPLAGIGLGFSNQSTGSVGELTKSIALKRILPVAGAIAGYSMFNDLSEDITGTSITGAFMNTSRRVNVGHRKAMDALGVTEFLDDMAGYNPVFGYWTEDEVKNAEELDDWYENGVSPVRKGRFWGFGSTSEYRGGKISYYAPNMYRRVHSDYYDKSVYGSNAEKWRHSYIPNIYNPIAPLTYAMDPYYLENKHYEDRPYMATGKMFTEGTPWGAVLNPTVGELVKPQKRMHTEHLNNTLQDTRWINEQENMKIFERAAETSIISFTPDGQVLPIDYTPLGLADAPYAVIKATANGYSSRGGSRGFGSGNGSGGNGGGFFEGMTLGEGSGSGDGGTVSTYLERDAGLNSLQDATSLNDLEYSDQEQAVKDRYKSGISMGTKSMDHLKSFILSPQTFLENKSKELSLQRIKAVNDGIMLHSLNAQRGIKMVDVDASRPKDVSFTNPEVVRNIRDISSSEDMIKDISYAGKELMGIYGFLSETALPSKHTYKMASADKINSFSDRFWDENIGGLGGEVMEIARRFFPHDDRTREGFNPIRNTMPSWLPDSFKLGDPYASIPLGEARLPGTGYESMNKLHPDQYGNYGSFDRFKILADIAPGSDEYKKWKKITMMNIESYTPEMVGDFGDTLDRVEKQQKKHDFREYKFKENMVSETATISEFLGDNRFKVVGSESIYKLAGVKFKNKIHLKQFIQPGAEVELRYAEDENLRFNDEGAVATIMYSGTENINRDLLKNNQVTPYDDGTAAGRMAPFTRTQESFGSLFETLGHYPIPYIHSKFARIESPLENYKNEQIYGTSYATWEHPIEGFIYPSFRKAWSYGPVFQAAAVGSWALSNHVSNGDYSKTAKILAGTVFGITNPGAFAGGALGFSTKLAGGKLIRTGANLGAGIGAAGYVYNHLDQPVTTGLSFAALTGLMANQLDFQGLYDYVKKNGEIIEGLPYEKMAKLFGNVPKAAAIAGGIGFGIGAMNRALGEDGEYIPEKVEEKREIEEYYDRLKYLKYEGLYKKAARLALEKEHVNVIKAMNEHEEIQEKIIDKKTDLLNYIKDNSNNLSEEIKHSTDIADTYSKMYPMFDVTAGYYTKLAVAYKQAADSTIYSLDADSSIVDIVRSLPAYDKDYFVEFMKEKDPGKRKEILKLVGEYKGKVLELAWEGKNSRVRSNYEYFNSHLLPNQYWAGWKPDVDLEKVKMKTIENEGLMLSDFGQYDSEKNTIEYKQAPNIQKFEQSNNIGPMLALKLQNVMDGLGIEDSSIEVIPNSTGQYSYAVNLVRDAALQFASPFIDAFKRELN